METVGCDGSCVSPRAPAHSAQGALNVSPGTVDAVPAMRFVDDSEAAVLAAVAALADGNPFLPDRVESERRALGPHFERTSAVWHAEADLAGTHPNLPRLRERVEALAPLLRERLASGARARKAELVQYEGLVRHLLYMRYENEWFALITAAERGDPTNRRIGAYRRFARDVAHFCDIPGVKLPVASPAAHLFAWGFQIRRAFHHTYRRIYGGSMPAARLRAAVWQSIFTRDVQRYRRGLFERMGDIPTLISGASGTGKELVARAIGLSRYIPFDERSQTFRHDYAAGFHAVNLSALSPTLIESELFGHRHGAFTGAVEDRSGWLETCGPHGTVFLDEIGELDGAIQVKLLRVLQTRTFQRIGETTERRFEGKIIAATHRDLAAEMRAGRFRPDFYYRLCADLVTAPSLREQLAGEGGEEELSNLLLVIARRVAGDDEGTDLAREASRWIAVHLGRDYPWPGNVRELEQCVRNVLIRGEYTPPDVAGAPAVDALPAALAAGELSAEDLMRVYCTHVYAAAGSYEEAARRLGLDRRTVKAKLDRELLERLRSRR
jgi:transcriptional regulator with AAA-type ATPase domain